MTTHDIDRLVGAAGAGGPDSGRLYRLMLMLRAAKRDVTAATTAALAAYTVQGATLTITATGALAAQDGVTLVAGDRLLVKDEVSGSSGSLAQNNGVYVVENAGDTGVQAVLVRAADCDDHVLLAGSSVFVRSGTVNGGRTYKLATTGTIAVGTTPQSWTVLDEGAALDLATAEAFATAADSALSSALSASTKARDLGAAKLAVQASTSQALATYDATATTLTGHSVGAFGTTVPDGVTLAVNDSILVRHETAGNAKYNGIYTVTALGDGSSKWVLTRRADAIDGVLGDGAIVWCEGGTTFAKRTFVLSVGSAIVVGTTAQSWYDRDRDRPSRTVSGGAVTIGVGDLGGVIHCSNDGAVAVALPDLSSVRRTGYDLDFVLVQEAAGTLCTVTPAAGQADGGATSAMTAGVGSRRWWSSDGLNWFSKHV